MTAPATQISRNLENHHHFPAEATPVTKEQMGYAACAGLYRKVPFVRRLEEKLLLLFWTLSTSRSYQLVTAVSGRLELIYNALNRTACVSCALRGKRPGFIPVPGTENPQPESLMVPALTCLAARDKK